MSSLSLIDADESPTTYAPRLVPMTGIIDNVGAVLDKFWRARNPIGTELANASEFKDNRDRYRDITGTDLLRDAVEFGMTIDERRGLSRNQQTGEIRVTPQIEQMMDNFVGHLQTTQKQKYKGIFKRDKMREIADRKAKEAIREEAKVSAGATGFDSAVGGFIGGFAASLVDPINILAMAIPMGASISLARKMLMEAAVNAGAEAATVPFIKNQMKRLGEEYGNEEIISNIAFAAIFGAGFVGIIGGLGKIRGLSKSKSFAHKAWADELIRKLDTKGYDVKQIARSFYLKEGMALGISEKQSNEILQEIFDSFQQNRRANIDKIVPDLDEKVRRSFVDETQKTLHSRYFDEPATVAAKADVEFVQTKAGLIARNRLPPEPIIPRKWKKAKAGEYRFQGADGNDVKYRVKKKGKKWVRQELDTDGSPKGEQKSFKTLKAAKQSIEPPKKKAIDTQLKKPTVADNLVEKDTPDIENEARLEKIQESPEFIAQQDADFVAAGQTPAGKAGALKIQDDIRLEDGTVLKEASYEKVVEIVEKSEAELKVVSGCQIAGGKK